VEAGSYVPDGCLQHAQPLNGRQTLRKFNEEQARHAEASRARKDAEAEEVAQLEREMAQQVGGWVGKVH